MKAFIKGERNNILLVIFLGLMFILWAKVVTAEIQSGMHLKNLTTLDARIKCVESFGWEVDPGSEMRETVNIPDEFDAVYTEYNKIQKMCGFNLLKYRGSLVERYTYIVLNPPFEVKTMLYANIFVYEDKMIGGDCITPEIDGFILPIARER